MRPPRVDAASDIEAVAAALLKESKALGVYPTPVDLVIAEAKLTVDESIDLSQARPGLIARTFEGIGKVSRKVLGLLDCRHKTIYLDLTQKEPRQRFIKLHETGHDVLVWQADAYRWDDEKTLDPGTKETFEREASYFASCVLFQGDRFDEEAGKLPLGIKSALALAKKFGSSCQSAIRRYAERSGKRCAVLVLEPPDSGMRARIRDCFESAAFAEEFGVIPWSEHCGPSFPFVQDMLCNRRYREGGSMILQTRHGDTAFAYHYFSNKFNRFVLFFPPGECIRSRARVVLATAQV